MDIRRNGEVVIGLSAGPSVIPVQARGLSVPKFQFTVRASIQSEPTRHSSPAGHTGHDW